MSVRGDEAPASSEARNAPALPARAPRHAVERESTQPEADDATSAWPTVTDGAPTLYAGRFELRGLLGVGAVGSVYRAYDRRLDEVVAIKVLRSDLTQSPLPVTRFYREVKLARRVSHPNVARVYDAAEHAGEHYMTMECVEGESLHALLDGGRALDPPRAISIAVQIARALGAAHAQEIVHCDLKPENVVVEAGGRAVLTDFGVSTIGSGHRAQPTAGHAGGTPLYMAPEQLEGRAVDARTDLYALGLLLYEMLTGRTPWGRRGGQGVSAARFATAPKRPRTIDPSIPEELDAIVMRLLAREPDARFASAREVEENLSTVAARAEHLPTLPPPELAPASEPSTIATTETPAARGIAVLPLRNLGEDRTRYLAEALTTEIVDRLALAPTLRVASRASIEAGPGEDLRALGRRLGVEAIVEGSLMARSNGEMRCSVRLLEAERGFVLWSARLDRPARDLFEIADEVVRDVGRALGIDVVTRAAHEPRRPSSDDAIDPFLRAKEAYGVYTAEGAREAERTLSDAHQRSPRDAILASWFALASLRRWAFEPARGLGDDAAPAVADRVATRVLQDNPNVGEAHLALGVLAHMRGTPAIAMRHAREALRCAPTLAEAHHLAGILGAEASTTYEGERALELSLRLEGRHVLAILELARVRALKRDFERARQWLDVAEARVQEHPGALVVRLLCARWEGDDDAFAREAARVARLPTGARSAEAHAARALARVDEDVETGMLAATALMPGTPPRTRVAIMKILAELRARAGDVQGAVSALRSADADGLVDLLWLERCPSLEPLRATPGFATVRASIVERAVETLRGPSAH